MEKDKFVLPDGLLAYGVPWTGRWLLDLEKAGKLPRRIRLSQNRVVWSEIEILEWIEDRKAARSDPSQAAEAN